MASTSPQHPESLQLVSKAIGPLPLLNRCAESRIDRFEIPVFLCLLQRILEYDRSVERSSIFSERCGSELHNPASRKPGLKCAPRWRFNMVRLVNK